MRPILFEIPLPFGDAKLPIFSFGVMLLVSFIVGFWITSRMGKRIGIDPNAYFDVMLWLFIGGLIGARVTSMILEGGPGGWAHQALQFFKIWEGGMVFYGCIPGVLVAYFFVYRHLIKPKGMRTLQLADLAAPAIGLGLFFGRIGCLLNGCCYGDVALPDGMPAWRTLQFPGNSPPHHRMVQRGLQTAFGFILAEEFLPPQYLASDPRTVMLVEPGTAAALAGLKEGDRILAVDGQSTPKVRDVEQLLLTHPLHKPVQLTVLRAAGQTVELSFLQPPSLPLQPAQIYSSLDGLLLALLLFAFYPLRRREGDVMALLMLAHGVSRYHLEQLRSDNPEFWLGLTVSQWISLVLIVGGTVMLVALWKWGRPPGPVTPPSEKPAAPPA